jgi:hypothetical protein
MCIYLTSLHLTLSYISPYPISHLVLYFTLSYTSPFALSYISPHFISPHFISPHFISPHFISPHFISPCPIPHLTSSHLTSSHLTSSHLILYLTSLHLTSLHLTSLHLTLSSYHLTLSPSHPFSSTPRVQGTDGEWLDLAESKLEKDADLDYQSLLWEIGSQAAEQAMIERGVFRACCLLLASCFLLLVSFCCLLAMCKCLLVASCILLLLVLCSCFIAMRLYRYCKSCEAIVLRLQIYNKAIAMRFNAIVKRW